MEINPNPIINPANWANTLQEAVGSRHGDQVHKYIVRDGNGRLSVTENPRSDQRKLTIREIVDETRANLAQNADNLKRSTLEDPQLLEVASNIKAFTKELIDDRAAKREHSLLRKTAKFFSAVGCLVLVGIPFYRNLVKGDSVFKEQTASLKREIDQPPPSSIAAPNVATSAVSSRVAAPISAEVAAEVAAAREAIVQQLQSDYRLAAGQLATQSDVFQELLGQLAIESNQDIQSTLQTYMDNQQQMIRHCESEVEGIRRQLEEIGGEIPTAQPPTTELATPRLDPQQLRALNQESGQLRRTIGVYERDIGLLGEVAKKQAQEELDGLRARLSIVDASIAELKQKE